MGGDTSAFLSACGHFADSHLTTSRTSIGGFDDQGLNTLRPALELGHRRPFEIK